MCGIAGFISSSEISNTKIEAILSHLKRRGPDNTSYEKIEGGFLGHTRLAIIDLEATSNQPLSNSNGRYIIVYNGEIYNYKQLRNELEGIGIQFNTKSDTEVILNGYIHYGAKFMTKLEGMWAFAIWDKSQKNIFLSRDRFGEKPLYYYESNGDFAFASNLASLCEIVEKKEINIEAVSKLISLQYIPTESCIYNNVSKVEPASNLIWSSSQKLQFSKYWTPDYTDKLDISVKDAEDKVDELLHEIIKRQLSASDVPVGLFLSGGVDSGLIAAIASKYKPGIESFTLGVPGSWRDETNFARVIADKHGIKNTQISLNENCISELPFLLEHNEPFGDSSLLPLNFISKYVSKDIRVVLTGDGGDEGFGGYGYPLIFKNLKRKKGFLLERYIRKFITNNRYRNKFLKLIRRYGVSINALAIEGLDLFLKLQDDAPDYILKDILFYPSSKSNIEAELQLLLNKNEKLFETEIDKIFFLGLNQRLVGDFLYKVDSGSMHHSLETRAPFLSHKLFDFCTKLDPEILFCDDCDKALLKRVASRYNPKEIVYASKKGFSIPKEVYFKGKWKNLLNELLDENITSDLKIFNKKGVKKMLESHSSFRPWQMSNQLYSILVMEIWIRVFHLKSHSAEYLSEKMLK